MSEDKEISWQTAEKKTDSVDSRRSIRVSLTYKEREAIVEGRKALRNETALNY
jgi:DNA-binding MarR family transcriptional regulator